MGVEKCSELLAKKDYEALRIYCASRERIEPNETIYQFYRAIALIHLHNFSEARAILARLYSKEGRPIYLIVSSMIHFIEGRPEEGAQELNEAIKRDDDVDELILIFELCMQELLLNTGQIAVKKALLKDKIRTIELMRSFFEEIAKDDKLTPSDRIDLINTLSLFERIVKSIDTSGSSI